MTNLVLCPSQQTSNKCMRGDTEANHMRLIADLIFDNLAKHKDINLYLVPPIHVGNDAQKLRKSVFWSNVFINQHGGEGYHLGLHSDAGKYATGASLLYRSDQGLKFGKPIIEELINLTPWKDVGIKKRLDLHELNNTIAYAAILEVSFHDNANEAKWIHDNLKLIADKATTGIIKAVEVG